MPYRVKVVKVKIIDAFWEKRNLGVDVIEIEIGKKDLGDTSEIIAKIEELKAPCRLLNVKIPVASLELLHALEGIGFRFLECQLKISRSLKDYEPPAEMQPLLEKTGVHVIEKSHAELEALLERITPGMFSTDRICLDPLWGASCEELSATRYRNWIADIFFEDDVVSYFATHFSQHVGFGVARTNQKANSVQILLGGTFKEQGNPFASVAFINAPIILFMHSLKLISVAISSNNMPICRLYNQFFFKLNEILYVLRLFCDR